MKKKDSDPIRLAGLVFVLATAWLAAMLFLQSMPSIRFQQSATLDEFHYARRLQTHPPDWLIEAGTRASAAYWAAEEAKP